MQYSFTLPTAAFSVNAYRYSRGFAKTKEARIYEERILDMLDEHKTLHDMADVFRAQGGAFRVSITCQYPKHVFYNQAGHISAKTFDLSNVEKPILDLVFCNFMDTDDRFVTELVSKKEVGATWAIKITIELF